MESNRSNRFNFLGLSIMIGLMALGLFIKSSVTTFKSYDRVISVKGLAEMEVPANKVIWPIPLYKAK